MPVKLKAIQYGLDEVNMYHCMSSIKNVGSHRALSRRVHVQLIFLFRSISGVSNFHLLLLGNLIPAVVVSI